MFRIQNKAAVSFSAPHVKNRLPEQLRSAKAVGPFKHDCLLPLSYNSLEFRFNLSLFMLVFIVNYLLTSYF